MANNRLYIEDTATGERFMLAKGWGDGWEVYPLAHQLTDWLKCRDMAAAIGQPKTTLRLVTENDLP